MYYLQEIIHKKIMAYTLTHLNKEPILIVLVKGNYHYLNFD